MVGFLPLEPWSFTAQACTHLWATIARMWAEAERPLLVDVECPSLWSIKKAWDESKPNSVQLLSVEQRAWLNPDMLEPHHHMGDLNEAPGSPSAWPSSGECSRLGVNQQMKDLTVQATMSPSATWLSNKYTFCSFAEFAHIYFKCVVLV